MNLTIIGRTITSSYRNHHANTFRSLLKAFGERGHSITFMERDHPEFARHRDLPDPDFCKVILYKDFHELKEIHSDHIRAADAVMIGSSLQEGVTVNELVFSISGGITIFYDIDPMVTITKLKNGDFEYIRPGQVRCFDLYLSFSGGPVLEDLMNDYHAPKAQALYASVDPGVFYPDKSDKKWKLGYLGTSSADRISEAEELLRQSARYLKSEAFVVAGSPTPPSHPWPPNVEHISHLSLAQHRSFYNAQEFTLHVSPSDAVRAGYSPDVRLFEAAACGVPVISDYWEGLDIFFNFGKEILIAKTWKEVVGFIVGISDEERSAIGERARQKVLQNHTSRARAAELERYIKSVSVRSGKVH